MIRRAGGSLQPGNKTITTSVLAPCLREPREIGLGGGLTEAASHAEFNQEETESQKGKKNVVLKVSAWQIPEEEQLGEKISYYFEAWDEGKRAQNSRSVTREKGRRNAETQKKSNACPEQAPSRKHRPC